MHFSEKNNALLHYFIISLTKNNNEIFKYWTIISDIALLMH